jgi:hypothetical protein
MSNRLESGPLPAAPVRIGASSHNPAHAVPASNAFGQVLERVATRIDAGEALVRRALHGTQAGLDPAQWVALQAGIYRYVEAVDLAGKLVDRAGNAVRTVLGNNH